MFAQTTIIISFIANLCLGLIIYFSSNKKSLYKWYLTLSTATAIWLLLNLLTGLLKSIWIFRGTYSLGILLPMIGYIWYLKFRNKPILSKKYNVMIIALSCLFGILPFIDGLIVLEAKEFFLGGMVGTLGPMYIFWAIYLFSFLFFLLFIITKDYRSSSGLKKSQTKYIMFGFYGFALIPLTVSVILPFFKILKFTWLDSFGSVPLVAFIGYAIAKYRLMNIRLVVTRSILYAVLVVLVTTFFTIAVFVSGNYIGEENKSNNIIIYLITSFIIVIGLDPLKNIFAKLTDRIFYKDKVDYQKVSQQASAVVAREIDLEKLSYALSNLLAVGLKIKEVSALIAKDNSFVLISTSQKTSQSFKLSADFISLVRERKEFIIIEELIRTQSDIGSETPYYQILDKFIKEAESFNVEMVVPIVDDNIVTAILLFSAKSSGDLYNQDDINFLKVLVPQIGTAIEKSKLYEEVQVFNRELQAKVEDRTKSLREANLGLEERNKFLTTMQAVTTEISRSLDFKQVNQMIANAIFLELGYIGGVLSFIDEVNHTLKIGAITDNEKTRDVIGILGRDPKSFEAQLKSEFSLGAQTVLSGKINFSDKMSDFFSPPVDILTINKVQKFLGVKTVVGLPIFSENKIIGIIHFLMAVERHHISAVDIETMTALTSQVGIASSNLRLYNNLQSANAELQEANLRLRELDRAKSEFLSIASHQLRTPISALKGYLSMMIDGDFGPVPDKIKVVIKDLFESASRLARLINVFLNVSRIESGRLKLEKHPIQVNDLIVSVIKELENQAIQKKLKLVYDEPKKAFPLVNADGDKLREVILNLIDNSIKYTLTGSVIVSASADSNDFHFVINDTGIGIDPEEAKTLFRKFVRGSGVAQIHTGGSGLGLFIAQKIIKEHGGQVWAESAGKGKGSTFQFVIPIDGNGEMTRTAKAEEFK